jgi:hypothetical protein
MRVRSAGSACTLRRFATGWTAAADHDSRRPRVGTAPPMAKKHKKGDKVSWKFGGNTAKGKVKERFTEKVTKKIKGSKITRKASKEKPAYLVETKVGKKALKSGKQLKKR